MDDWSRVEAVRSDLALAAALTALSCETERPAGKRLANFYNRATNVAGAIFVRARTLRSARHQGPVDLPATSQHPAETMAITGYIS